MAGEDGGREPPSLSEPLLRLNSGGFQSSLTWVTSHLHQLGAELEANRSERLAMEEDIRAAIERNHERLVMLEGPAGIGRESSVLGASPMKRPVWNSAQGRIDSRPSSREGKLFVEVETPSADGSPEQDRSASVYSVATPSGAGMRKAMLRIENDDEIGEFVGSLESQLQKCGIRTRQVEDEMKSWINAQRTRATTETDLAAARLETLEMRLENFCSSQDLDALRQDVEGWRSRRVKEVQDQMRELSSHLKSDMQVHAQKMLEDLQVLTDSVNQRLSMVEDAAQDSDEDARVGTEGDQPMGAADSGKLVKIEKALDALKKDGKATKQQLSDTQRQLGDASKHLMEVRACQERLGLDAVKGRENQEGMGQNLDSQIQAQLDSQNSKVTAELRGMEQRMDGLAIEIGLVSKGQQGTRAGEAGSQNAAGDELPAGAHGSRGVVSGELQNAAGDGLPAGAHGSRGVVSGELQRNFSASGEDASRLNAVEQQLEELLRQLSEQPPQCMEQAPGSRAVAAALGSTARHRASELGAASDAMVGDPAFGSGHGQSAAVPDAHVEMQVQQALRQALAGGGALEEALNHAVANMRSSGLSGLVADEMPMAMAVAVAPHVEERLQSLAANVADLQSRLQKHADAQSSIGNIEGDGAAAGQFDASESIPAALRNSAASCGGGGGSADLPHQSATLEDQVKSLAERQSRSEEKLLQLEDQACDSAASMVERPDACSESPGAGSARAGTTAAQGTHASSAGGALEQGLDPAIEAAIADSAKALAAQVEQLGAELDAIRTHPGPRASTDTSATPAADSDVSDRIWAEVKGISTRLSELEGQLEDSEPDGATAARLGNIESQLRVANQEVAQLRARQEALLEAPAVQRPEVSAQPHVPPLPIGAAAEAAANLPTPALEWLKAPEQHRQASPPQAMLPAQEILAELDRLSEERLAAAWQEILSHAEAAAVHAKDLETRVWSRLSQLEGHVHTVAERGTVKVSKEEEARNQLIRTISGYPKQFEWLNWRITWLEWATGGEKRSFGRPLDEKAVLPLPPPMTPAATGFAQPLTEDVELWARAPGQQQRLRRGLPSSTQRLQVTAPREPVGPSGKAMRLSNSAGALPQLAR